MTLDEYIAHMKLKLEEFEDMWRDENERNSDEFPMEFDSQFDWQEQLNCWLG